MVHMLVFTPTREIAHLQAGASYSSIWPERTQQLADVPQRFVSTASVTGRYAKNEKNTPKVSDLLDDQPSPLTTEATPFAS